MSDIERRIDALEKQALAGGGKLVIWWDCNGDPKPEHAPGDTVIRVVYDAPLEVSDDDERTTTA